MRPSRSSIVARLSRSRTSCAGRVGRVGRASAPSGIPFRHRSTASRARTPSKVILYRFDTFYLG
ncbi:MAG: hypothetical protein CL933_14655 [Deltaproteobacteria bacterium]|nr:hypothetical protein [Deltaproteobacteria bacterium]